MGKNKLFSIILFFLIILLSLRIIFFTNKNKLEIERLSKELKISADSLKKIHSTYLELEKNYDLIYVKLDSTRNQFNMFHSDLDLVMHSNITSLSKLNKELKLILEQEKIIPHFVSVKDSFRFN